MQPEKGAIRMAPRGLCPLLVLPFWSMTDNRKHPGDFAMNWQTPLSSCRMWQHKRWQMCLFINEQMPVLARIPDTTNRYHARGT